MNRPPSNHASPPSNEELEFKRKHLPLSPGCYLFKNSEGTVLYVGKAKSLRKRVSSYWKDSSKSKTEDPYYREKLHQLRQSTKDIEVFVVENEAEALLQRVLGGAESVLLKASRGVAMETLIPGLEERFGKGEVA